MSNRKDHWDRIHKDNSPLQQSWYQSDPDLSLSLIKGTGLPGTAAIIDIGGGASLLVDRMLDRGYQNLSVLDISGQALSYAQQRLGDRAGQVRWIEYDITRFRPDQTYDLWHDRAVFHFLTGSEDRRKYLAVLNQALLPGGHLIISTFAVGGPKQCSGLEIAQYDAAKMMTELGNNFDLIEQHSELHMTPSGVAQQFFYCHFKQRVRT